MKLLHLSDFHLGKRVHEFSMLEDQTYILGEILKIVDAERLDGILIAGDIYDKSIPSAEAVGLLSWVLAEIAERNLPVFIISGNHDSAERLAFASSLLEKNQVFISPVYNGEVKPISLEDEHGPVDIYLLPFIKPVHVRHCFPDEEIESYTDAVGCAIEHMHVDASRRNVLVTHQFVTGGERCESEELSVGGSDNVDLSVFAPFDYVALGHLHGPQNVGSEKVRYCGTPLKYSFSEANHTKSVTIVELEEKGTLSVRTLPLVPMRDMLDLRGTYDQLTARDYYQKLDQNAYVRITLSDENDIPDVMGKLRVIYPNLMLLHYDNARTRGGGDVVDVQEAVDCSPMELFAAFYEQQNGSPLSETQRTYLSGIIENIWEGQA